MDRELIGLSTQVTHLAEPYNQRSGVKALSTTTTCLARKEDSLSEWTAEKFSKLIFCPQLYKNLLTLFPILNMLNSNNHKQSNLTKCKKNRIKKMG